MGGDRRIWGVEFDERSTETTDGDGECEFGIVAMAGGGDGALALVSKCRRLKGRLKMSG